MTKEQKEIYDKALSLLVRREHSVCELRIKLLQRAFNEQLIDEMLQLLVEEKSLSDKRFAEGFVDYKAARGYGPIWLENALQAKGVSDSIISEILDNAEINWIDLANKVRFKKYGNEKDKIDSKEILKQSAFLKTRGFTYDHINAIYKLD